MENITIPEAWAWMLAAASALLILSNVAEKLAKAWRTIKAPNEVQDSKIKSLEGDMAHVKDCLDKDKRRLDGIEDGNRATQRAILALLDHGIDGNNIDQMRRAKEDLQTHLINR